RVVSGMVVGTGMEYFSYKINPTYARERFHEAHDLIGWGIGIYVGETDEEARREYEPHYWYYARNLLKTTPQQALPPGHTSLSSVMGMMQRRLQSRPSNLSTWEEVDKAGYVVVGSPETVRQRLEDYAKKVGFGLLIANFS